MKNLLLITSFISLSILSFAQNVVQNFSVRGVVTDSASKQPVDIVTVNLKITANELVRTAATKQGGVFSFDKLVSGKYTLTMIRIGYALKTISIDLTNAASPALDLGNIQFSAQNSQLATVSITADKPIVKQEIDKLTYDLQADPESKSNSVLDMMRKVPMLAVDGDDNIQLNGNGNYKIFINGKPSGMMESDPKNILKSMPASTIQSIEVITNPPAKYDAEGFGGIINIVMIKKLGNGYNGTANLNQRGPVSAGPGAGATLSFKQGKFGMSLNAGGSLPDNPIFPTSIRRITTGTSPTDLSQVGERNPNARNGNARAELSYEIDSLNLISATFYISGGGSEIAYKQSSVLTGSSGVIQSYKLNNNFVNRIGGREIGLNYQLGFRNNKSRLLTFSYRFFKNSFSQNSDVRVYDRINYTALDYLQYNHGRMSEQTFQLDYVHPVNKLSIEGGIKGILRNNGTNFQYHSFNAGNGNYVIDPGRSNEFGNNQNVYSTYNSYTYTLKNWTFKAGARIEQTTIDAEFISMASQFSKSFFNLIPSLSMQHKFKNMSSMTLAFNQRISRPGVSQLNPFVDRSNPEFESSGNPNLRPTVTNNIQLLYSKSRKASLTMGVGHNFYNNQIIPIMTFDPATNITRSAFENVGKARWFTFSLNVSYPITKTWSMSVNSQAAQGYVQGIVNGTSVKTKGFTYGVSGSTNYRFGKGWMVNANGSWNSPNLGSQAKYNAYASWTLGASKDVVKDKLSFSASISNPFDKMRTNIYEAFGPGFTQTSIQQTYFRQYVFTLNYRFGKLKEAIKKNRRGINNDDL